MKRRQNLLTLLSLLMCVAVTGCARSQAMRRVSAYGGEWTREPVTGVPDTYVRFDARVKQLTDGDVEALIPSLRALGTVHLELDDSAATYTVIPRLKRLPHLYSLMVRGTRVTPDGLLAKDMPRVTIIRWERAPKYPGGWRTAK